jgi:chlorobactene glucosyltransferase
MLPNLFESLRSALSPFPNPPLLKSLSPSIPQSLNPSLPQSLILFALPWLLPFLTLFRLARRRPNLDDPALATLLGPDPPLISVIIPARNEAATIETVVRSVLATAYPRMELLVVDDRSTDATAELVERLARRDVRLRLIRGGELPAGWYGKPWACHQGAGAARGAILVFTDADTRHEPALLGQAAGALLRQSADLVTIAPRQRCVTLWERLVMPQIWFLLAYRYHPMTVNRARRPRDVIANGQFIMVRRQSYEAVGGHEAVRGEVAEDLALAQRFLAAGGRLHFAFAEPLMETRMYRGLRHLIEGWSKNIYLGGRLSFPDEPVRRALVPVMLAAATLSWLLPPALLLLGWLGAVPGGLMAPMGLAAGLSLLFWALISAGMRIPPWYALGYPLGAAMTLYIVLRSTVRGARRVEWKGRRYGVRSKK